MKKIIILLCLSIILTSKFAYGKTFYVDKQLSVNCATGNYSIANRSCTGSDGNAYKTVASGISALSSGDTMYIRAGTYSENESTIPQLGNYSSKTTISAYGSESVTLNNTSSILTTLPTGTTNNVTIQNLHFTGLRGTNYDNKSIGSNSGSMGYIVVDNCAFDGAGHAHVKGYYKWWVKNCTFKNVGSRYYQDHHIYSWAPLSQGNEAIYENNYFENDGNMGAAIHLYSAGQAPTYHIIRYNIVRSIGGASAWGFLCNADYVTITNNSIYGPTNGITIQGHSNVTVKNNIIDHVTLYPLFFEGGATSVTATYNLTNSGGITQGPCTGCTISNNFTSTAPGWINATPSTWTDFRLSSSSAAINAGANLGASYQFALDPNFTSWPPLTLNQNNQGAGWEIGAFVYREGGAVPPSPPQDVNIIKN